MNRNIQLLRQLCTKRLASLKNFTSSRSFSNNKYTTNSSLSTKSTNIFFLRCFASQPVPSPSQISSTSSQDLFSKTISELEKKKEESKIPSKSKVLTEKGVRIRAPDEAWAKANTLKGSMKKVKLVAGLIRGLSYKNAVIQLKLCEKRLAVDVLKCLESARYNAENNHNLDPARLIVSEVLIGRKTPLHGVMYRAKGRINIITKRRSGLTIILKQLPEKDRRLFSRTQYRKMVMLQEKAQVEEAKQKDEEETSK